MKTPIAFIFFICLLGCNSTSKNSYKTLLNTLEKQTDIIELTSNNGNSRVLISPYHQGRIISSTYSNLDGISNGWINQKALTDSTKSIGGEERLWIGPLGGQFSFYFQQIKPLHDDNWKVPTTIDAEPYQLVNTSKIEVELSKTMKLTNFVGTRFNLKINRKISILSKEKIQNNLNIKLNESIDYVAFETINKLTNTDSISWTKETGLPGLWSAGMYPGDDSIVIIPLMNNGKKKDVLTYLATIDSTKFIVKNNVVLFKTDGQYRSKIGIPPEYAPNTYGCYSKKKNKLTIVQYKKEQGSMYSNSYVSYQENPYQGEAIPIYNNASDFYELESNAPLKELKPNESSTHWQRVYHFSGKELELNHMTKALLKINLKDCKL